MSHLSRVLNSTRNIPHMTDQQAHLLQQLMITHQPETCAELGTFHGKSALIHAAILEDLGAGSITTYDMAGMINSISPTCDQLAHSLNLSHRLHTVVAEKTYMWELAKLIRSTAEPIWDWCYIDGAHHYAGAALSFYLADELLKPGGIVLFDDIGWMPSGAHVNARERAIYEQILCEEQFSVCAVDWVCDQVARNGRYLELTEPAHTAVQWRVFRRL